MSRRIGVEQNVGFQVRERELLRLPFYVSAVVWAHREKRISQAKCHLALVFESLFPGSGLDRTGFGGNLARDPSRRSLVSM